MSGDPYGGRPVGEAFNDPRVPCCGRDAADCDCVLQLVIHVRETEPYPVECDDDLREAIESEASTIAADAGSDLLADPGEEEREALRENVVREATAALRVAGDSYRDPTGVHWSLEVAP